ncbi:MAG: sugar O-acetyltransferase [Bacteroidota bacterium]
MQTTAPSALDRLRAGLAHRGNDPGLIMIRQKARRLVREFNALPEDQRTARIRTLASLFGALGERTEIDAPIFCEYGQHVHVGDHFVAGPNCVLTDVGKITIGDRVRFGPGVHVYAVARPVNPGQRAEGLEQAAPVTIGDDVWIGGGSILNPGVTIGAGSTVGSGSVVLEDVPAGVFASGNPCRVVREL